MNRLAVHMPPAEDDALRPWARRSPLQRKDRRVRMVIEFIREESALVIRCHKNDANS